MFAVYVRRASAKEENTPMSKNSPAVLVSGGVAVHEIQQIVVPRDDPKRLEQTALLRNLRAEVQDLAQVLDQIGAGATSLKLQAGYLQKTLADLGEIKDKLSGDDATRHIINVLEQIDHSPLLTDPTGEISPEDQTTQRALLVEQIHKLEYWIGVLTIPERLNAWLAQSKPGYYVPFHRVFEDEVPVQADRQRILDLLAWSPRAIQGGVVDTVSGLIYRYAEDRMERLRSLGWLAAAVLASILSILVIAGLYGATIATVDPATGMPLLDESDWWERTIRLIPWFIVGWLAVLVGVAAHVGVDTAKRKRATGLPAMMPVSEFPLILNSRSGEFVWKLILAVMGFSGLVFTLGVENVNILVFNSFLVGYSLDSFVDLLGTTVDQHVTALHTKLG
jgi:hypothetical protein